MPSTLIFSARPCNLQSNEDKLSQDLIYDL
jgi:hypothetical protein